MWWKNDLNHLQKGLIVTSECFYLPAFEEFEGSADVGNPVNPLQLAALLRGLNEGQTVKIKLANQYKDDDILIQLSADLRHGKK